ncbi:hypothetical protein C9374_003775 [Naegleria lovaniensis]|uniref:glycerol-3-phosphate dehydrogenase n=1 Tax=Naegleria lovaniensis TaxID=51637 RepID=A0AA88KS98_NAELO|nr:uncharacterized protein C9374_003775 [Naegleria lovaniensis]KAG2394011.1 hypothetical protein C9374_003775 [Naegleria lovaniensis]
MQSSILRYVRFFTSIQVVVVVVVSAMMLTFIMFNTPSSYILWMTSSTSAITTLWSQPSPSWILDLLFHHHGSTNIHAFNKNPHHDHSSNVERKGYHIYSTSLPTRSQLIAQLSHSNTTFNSTSINVEEKPIFDVIVIGGGCVGSGIALDAAHSHSLKVALFEKEDFGSGTSSRSTKLLHGGVRYLRKAFHQFDLAQFKLVREALEERFYILNHLAPHLTNTLPIITPIYEWSEFIPTMIQLKLYDWMSTSSFHVAPSYFVSAERALELFPMIKKHNLKGAMVYHDGQFDDARLNLALIQTAIHSHQVVALNRFKVIKLLHSNNEDWRENEEKKNQELNPSKYIDNNEIINNNIKNQELNPSQYIDNNIKNQATTRSIQGVMVRDELTQQVYTVKSRVVINAAGHFADDIRFMDDENSQQVLQASVGIHIVLNGTFCPSHEGLLISKTKDKRVIFLLPWQNKTLVGTTDSKFNESSSYLTNHPTPREEDIQYLLDHVNEYFNVQVRRSDVKSAWAGIRPLKKPQFPSIGDQTASISREHAIYTSPSGLYTIIGGKWTTYRSMASDIMHRIVQELKEFKSSSTHELKSSTRTLSLYGSLEFNSTYHQFMKFERDISQHINQAYGDQGYLVEKIALEENLSSRIHPQYPYIEAEVIYSIRNEYALKIMDIIERRTRLYFIDTQASIESIPKISKLMAQELGWNEHERLAQVEECMKIFEKHCN